MRFVLWLVATLLPFSACRTPANSQAVEESKIHALCMDLQQPELAKCTDYQGLLISLETSFASSCQEQGGSWRKDFKCKIESGTRGCRREGTGGGPTVVTWYTGDGFQTTEIQCPNMVLITK